MNKPDKRRKTRTTVSQSIVSTNKSAPFWHALVHRQFGEELFYFLIACKPYDESKCFEGLRKTMNEFGVVDYGAYPIFGQFDILLRVWLPAGQGQQFMDRADELVPNLKGIFPFHVTKIQDEWRFPKQLNEKARSQIATISPRQIWEVQCGNDLQLKNHLTRLNLYTVVKDYRSKNTLSIKAFIALSEPNNLNKEKRDAIFVALAKLVNDTKNLDQRIIYSGYGFTWTLIKVVAGDFYTIGGLVESLAKQFRQDGISSNTYFVASNSYREGECISRRALDSKDGDENVRLLLPELYTASDLNENVKEEIESFVKRKIITNNSLELKDRVALQGFLKAVILNNKIDAFTALFPRFVQTEQELRDMLLRAAVRADGGTEKICREMDPEKRWIKSAKTMSMSYVLKGCRNIVQRLASDPSVALLDDGQLDNIANFRNKIMHGGEFDCHEDWKTFAQATVSLAEVRKILFEKLENYEKNISDQTTG